MILIGSLKKLINNDVFEKSADFPWARFSDFIISKDGEIVEAAVLSSISLVPVPYVVRFCDFDKIDLKNAVLKEGVKPFSPLAYYGNPLFIKNIKRHRITREKKVYKVCDVSFDVNRGEVVDYIAASYTFGKKVFFDSKSADVKAFILTL